MNRNISRRRRMTPVLQTADSDCAPACLAMILKSFGRNASLAAMRELLDPGRDGTTMSAIRDAATSFGLVARAVRTPAQAIAGGGPALPTPFIAHWDGDHFVVVERIRSRHVDLVDPAIGRRRLTRSEFLDHAKIVLLFGAGDPAAKAAGPPLAPPVSPFRVILAPLIRRHRGRLVLTIVVSLLLTMLGLAVPAAAALITNDLADGQTPTTAWILVAPLLAAAVGLLALIRGLGAATLQRGLAQDLTVGVARRMFESEYRYFERRSTGDLFLRIASADMVREMLGVSLVGSLLDTVLALGYVVVLLCLDPFLAGVAMVIFAFQLAAVLRLAARIRRQHREELLASADADSLIVDAIGGIASIRTSAAEATILGKWSGFVDRRLDVATRRSRTTAVMAAVTTTGEMGAPILFLFVAAASATSPGAAIGLAALAGAVLAPLTSLSLRFVTLAELGPLLERMLDVMSAPREGAARGRVLDCPPGAVGELSAAASPGRPRPAATSLAGAIELDNAGFRYDIRSPFVFRGLNVRIRPGTKVAVVGASGCGKSTLISALTGLHPLTEGRLLLDGKDIGMLDLPSVRRQIGVVLQDPYLGIGTIRDAITLGRQQAVDEEIFRAAQIAAVHEEIMSMPLGYSTPIAEGGRGVSGGQRQRIALARALLGNPSVLILDEATSALDVSSESIIEDGLRTLRMTRIVIAHRLSTVADADLVLVMHAGQFVEGGPPGMLLQHGGHYAAMVARQGGAALPAVTPPPPGPVHLELPARAGRGRHRADEHSIPEGHVAAQRTAPRHLHEDDPGVGGDRPRSVLRSVESGHPQVRLLAG